MAAKITPDWANVHQPVISRPKLGHQVYYKFRYEEPDGQIYFCPSKCRRDFLAREMSRSTVRVICRGCPYRATITKGVAQTTPLGKKSLAKVVFPRPVLVIDKWDRVVREDDEGGEQVVRSNSLSTLDETRPTSSGLKIRLPPRLMASTMDRTQSTSVMAERRNAEARTPHPSPADTTQPISRKRSTSKGNQKQKKKQRN